jgi:hypothetical protein
MKKPAIGARAGTMPNVIRDEVDVFWQNSG